MDLFHGGDVLGLRVSVASLRLVLFRFLVARSSFASPRSAPFYCGLKA